MEEVDGVSITAGADGLLTKEMRGNCIPSEAELDAYLATPDDAVASKLREELGIEDFRKLAKIILYTENIEKAQQTLTQTKERERIEQFLRIGKDYKLHQRKKSGSYFEHVVHPGEWERFWQSLDKE